MARSRGSMRVDAAGGSTCSELEAQSHNSHWQGGTRCLMLSPVSLAGLSLPSHLRISCWYCRSPWLLRARTSTDCPGYTEPEATMTPAQAACWRPRVGGPGCGSWASGPGPAAPAPLAGWGAMGSQWEWRPSPRVPLRLGPSTCSGAPGGCHGDRTGRVPGRPHWQWQARSPQHAPSGPPKGSLSAPARPEPGPEGSTMPVMPSRFQVGGLLQKCTSDSAPRGGLGHATLTQEAGMSPCRTRIFSPRLCRLLRLHLNHPS